MLTGVQSNGGIKKECEQQQLEIEMAISNSKGHCLRPLVPTPLSFKYPKDPFQVARWHLDFFSKVFRVRQINS